MSKIRMAVIGAGHLGRIHSRLLRALPDVELVGVVDPLPQARDEVATSCRTAAFAHHSEILGRIDAAIIATPTKNHHQVGMDLLNRGIHLFVEKPLALAVCEADDLINTASRRNLVLQVGHVEQFNPALLAVKPYLQSPRYVEATRTSPYTFRSTDIGVVLDLMIHDLDIVLSLATSPIIDVRSAGFSMINDLEDVAHARIEFADGCVVSLTASRCSAVSQRAMQVITGQCTATVNFAEQAATLMRPSEALLQGRHQCECQTPSQRAYWKDHLFDELLQLDDVAVQDGNAILTEQQDFVSCIRHGRKPQVDGHQARAALAVAERIISGMTLQRWSEKIHSPDAAIIKLPNRSAA